MEERSKVDSVAVSVEDDEGEEDVVEASVVVVVVVVVVVETLNFGFSSVMRISSGFVISLILMPSGLSLPTADGGGCGG